MKPITTSAAGIGITLASVLALLLGPEAPAYGHPPVPAASASSQLPAGSPAPLSPLPPGAHLVGPADPTGAVSFDVVLSPRDPAALRDFIAALYDPASPAYHHFLTPGQFRARFAPDPGTVARVRRDFAEAGLALGPVAADGVIIPGGGPAARVASALHTRLDSYRLPDGSTGIHPRSAPLLPADISASVTGVVGLDTTARLRPALARPGAHPGTSMSGASPSSGSGVNAADSGVPSVTAHVAGPQPCSAATQAAISNSSLTAPDLSNAYGFTAAYAASDLGAGQAIALYELEPYGPSDITTFDSCYFITPKLTPVNVDGGPVGPQQGESVLDIEDAQSIAPQASYTVYQGPNAGNGPLDVWSRIVNDDTAKVVSTSWGQCEQSMSKDDANAEGVLFAQAATQGQTILAAAGDSGSEDCYDSTNPATTSEYAVDDPGSQPYVTSVGGTTLPSGDPAGVSAEDVWNSGPLSAGGGGISTFQTMQSWQSSPGVHNAYSSSAPCQATGGTLCREVPDVAASADPNHGYTIYFSQGGWQALGGTSAASPLWAALTALSNQKCGTNAGFLNPTLYKVAQTNPSSFHDINTGDTNDALAPGAGPTKAGKYPTAPGFDLATGLGTPTSSLLSSLCTGPPPPPTPCSMSPGASATSMVSTPDGKGYWIASTVGDVAYCGDAGFFGSPAAQGITLAHPVVALSSTSDGKGYWIVTADGTVYTYGDAAAHGDIHTAGVALVKGIVSMAASGGGTGYWLLGGDGGVFSFGTAQFYGSTGNIVLNKPAIAMVGTADSGGYWFVASDGGVFAYADAAFYGSMGAVPLSRPVVGMTLSSTGHGYRMVGADGGLFSFGDAVYYGSLPGNHQVPGGTGVVAMAPTPDARGYWILDSLGVVYAFGDASSFGNA